MIVIIKDFMLRCGRRICHVCLPNMHGKNRQLERALKIAKTQLIVTSYMTG